MSIDPTTEIDSRPSNGRPRGAMQTFRERARAALLQPALQRAITRATDKFVSARNRTVAETPGFEQAREQARQIKRHVLENLDQYLEQFAARVTERGGHVHWASDASEACSFIAALAAENGARRVVKSKSMVTEEIELNHALESQAVEVIETDLGDFIIQLAGETPSHLLAPALHKSRSDVATLFAEKLGIAYTDDVEQLTAAARGALRNKFLEADMGVSGVNFGIAETGTIVILENEGNARLTTSLPRIHVAVMGTEKLIPRFDDLATFLQVLPRSATGQIMSSYVSLITGTKMHAAGEGPEQLHVVILDNGRSRILADKIQREALACIRCSACLNICPVYRSVGGHAYGWVYQGPIGALITPQLSNVDCSAELPFASSLCGACRDVCPVKIDIPDLLLDLRAKISTSHKRPSSRGEAILAMAFAFVIRHPALYRLTAALARRMQPSTTIGGAMKTGSLPLVSAWTESRDFPAMAPRSFNQIWREELHG